MSAYRELIRKRDRMIQKLRTIQHILYEGDQHWVDRIIEISVCEDIEKLLDLNKGLKVGILKAVGSGELSLFASNKLIELAGVMVQISIMVSAVKITDKTEVQEQTPPSKTLH